MVLSALVYVLNGFLHSVEQSAIGELAVHVIWREKLDGKRSLLLSQEKTCGFGDQLVVRGEQIDSHWVADIGLQVHG